MPCNGKYAAVVPELSLLFGNTGLLHFGEIYAPGLEGKEIMVIKYPKMGNHEYMVVRGITKTEYISRAAECGIELKDVAIRERVEIKNGKKVVIRERVYDAITINGIVVGKFDCPLNSEWTKEVKQTVRSTFFGKWNVSMGDTFICSNGSTKTFLVLSK